MVLAIGLGKLFFSLYQFAILLLQKVCLNLAGSPMHLHSLASGLHGPPALWNKAILVDLSLWETLLVYYVDKMMLIGFGEQEAAQT